MLFVHGVACGLQDFEMAIIEHYYEALGVMSELFTYIFDGIADRYKVTLPLPTSHPPTSFSLVYREGAKGTDIFSCSVPPCYPSPFAHSSPSPLFIPCGPVRVSTSW